MFAVNVLENFQTLATGLIALLVGFATILVLGSQIKSNEKTAERGRILAVAGRTWVYEKAVKDYFRRINRVISLVNARHRHACGAENGAITEFMIERAESDYLPKALTPPLRDWHFFAEMETDDVTAIVQIVACLETAHGLVEELHVGANSQSHKIAEPSWTRFIDNIRQLEIQAEAFYPYLTHRKLGLGENVTIPSVLINIGR